MKKPCVVVAVLLAILWTTLTAEADPRFNGRGGSRTGIGTPTHAFRGFVPHRFAPRRFVPFGVVVIGPRVDAYSSPPVFYAPPPYPGSPVYSGALTVPPTVYSSSAYGPPAPTAPASPRVVEYATGRYELRGDGIGTPYIWVWIPNPPAAPPAGAATSGDAPPASRSQVYRWVDEQGVVHWTNRAETIPRRYRQSS